MFPCLNDIAWGQLSKRFCLGDIALIPPIRIPYDVWSLNQFRTNFAGANDTDCLKQQTAAIQDDLHFIKPKMFEQFATISKEFISLQRTMVHIKGQLNDIAHSVSVLCTAPADGAIPPIQISPLGESDQPSPPGYREVVTPSSSDVSYYLRGDPPSSAFTGTDPPAPPTTTSTTSRRLGTFVRTPLLNFLDRQRASHAQQGSLTGEPEFTFTF